MKTAIVTGASSGIGLAISKALIELGYKIYGFGRHFTSDCLIGENFVPIVCELTDTKALLNQIEKLKKLEEIKVLVNNAGVGYFGLHEELDAMKIHEMVTVNCEVPLLLSQVLLRTLKKNKGYIINISSVSAKQSSPHGCAYGATKAALSHFSNSLFDEARKYGVKVACLHPDMTRSNFYRHADFKEGEEEESFILPEEVAASVLWLLEQREDLVISEMTLQPQKHRITKKTEKKQIEKAWQKA